MGLFGIHLCLKKSYLIFILANLDTHFENLKNIHRHKPLGMYMILKIIFFIQYIGNSYVKGFEKGPVLTPPFAQAPLLFI